MPHPIIVFNSTGKSRRPVRRHFTAHFDRDNVATRQVSLQNLYSRLVEMAEVNRICMFSGLGPVYKEGGGPQEGVVTRNPPFLLTSHMVTSRRRRWGIFLFFLPIMMFFSLAWKKWSSLFSRPIVEVSFTQHSL